MTLFNEKMQKINLDKSSESPAQENPAKAKFQSHEIEKHVGKKIKLFRQLKGLSQSDVAVHLGITFQQFQKYESGKNRIPISRLMRLAEIFGVNMTVFFENSVNVMFEDVMGKASNCLNEDFTPIESTPSIRKISEEKIEDDETKNLLKSFKAIKDIGVRKHITMLVKSLSEETKA
jgi:transcriptional regulator with XRE-family HTH domain